MELANFGPLLHTASTSTNNSLNPAVESFLEPCRMSSAERVTFRAVVQWTASL